jgi:hypothetical protein
MSDNVAKANDCTMIFQPKEPSIDDFLQQVRKEAFTDCLAAQAQKMQQTGSTAYKETAALCKAVADGQDLSSNNPKTLDFGKNEIYGGSVFNGAAGKQVDGFSDGPGPGHGNGGHGRGHRRGPGSAHGSAQEFSHDHNQNQIIKPQK